MSRRLIQKVGAWKKFVKYHTARAGGSNEI